MDIIPIFEEEISLCAFQYDNEDVDEFERVFDLWNDVSYLKKFFEENKRFLQSGFYGGITIDQAVNETLDDTDRFEEYVLDVAQKKINGLTLDNIFIEIYNKIASEGSVTKTKGLNRKSWLRIYAVKIESNVYAVTGGAIKLTKFMNEAPDTDKEVRKFDVCKDFLKDEAIVDGEGLKDYLEQRK